MAKDVPADSPSVTCANCGKETTANFTDKKGSPFCSMGCMDNYGAANGMDGFGVGGMSDLGMGGMGYMGGGGNYLS